MKKIGILGGTFDPVHLGHIGLAKDAKEQAGLDELVFVPAKLQPFKLDKKITSGEDRLKMINLAAEDFEGFKVSSYEMNSKGISYTYLTLRNMKELYGSDSKLYFITGTDAFLKIEYWKESRELLENYSFIIGSRPGYRAEELTECIERIRRGYNTEIKNINNTQIDISSTEIRERLKFGASASDLIPEKVEEYIKTKGLYIE